MSPPTSYICRVIACRASLHPIVTTLDLEYRFEGFALSIPINVLPRVVRFAFHPHLPLISEFSRASELDSIFETRSMSIAYLTTTLFDYFLEMDAGETTSMLSGPRMAVFPIFRNDSGRILDPQRLMDIVKPVPLRSLIAGNSDIAGIVVSYMQCAIRIDKLSHDMSAADIPGKRRRKKAKLGPLAVHFQASKNEDKFMSPLFIDIDFATSTPLKADVIQYLFAFLHIMPILRQIYRIRGVLTSLQIANVDLYLDMFRRALQVSLSRIHTCSVRPRDKSERRRRVCLPADGAVSKEWIRVIDEDLDRFYSDHLSMTRMSFLGNAVILFVLASQLIAALPNASEGVLTQLRASLFNQSYIGSIVKKLKLDTVYLCDEAERRSMSSKTHLSIFCSMFGVLYRCQGIRACREILTHIIFDSGPQDLCRYWSGSDLKLVSNNIIADHKEDWWDGLENLQSAMRIKCQSPVLLSAALTAGSKHQERLEFLGDAVLQLLVTDLLLDLQPDSADGHLVLLRTALVKNANLERVAKKLDLENCLTYECYKQNRKRIADAVEALVGAVYLDRNLGLCREFISRFIIDDEIMSLESESLLGPKNRLQEYLVSVYSSPQHYPVYVQSKSCSKSDLFEVRVYYNKTLLATGTGRTLKEAENDAAENALKAFENAEFQNAHDKV